MRLADILGGGPRPDVAVQTTPGERAIDPPATPIGASMLAAFGRAEAGEAITPPNPYVFRFRQAVVQSASGIVALGSGELIEDTLDHTDPDRDGYVRVGFHEVRGHDGRPRTEGGRVCLAPVGRYLEGKHLSLLLGGVQNFYHWMVMNLGRLSILERSDLDGVKSILVPSWRARFQEESIALLGLSRLAAIRPVDPGEALSVDELVVPWHVASETGVRVEAVRYLRTMMPAGGVPGGAPDGRVIYVDRRKSPTRTLANEPELVEALGRYGVDALVLEDMTLSEQVLAFQRASIIIGPHGAGLTNMIFCQPGTTVLEIIALESLNHCYRNLSAACGHRYDFVIGRRVHGAGNHGLAEDAWVVSVHHVLAALVHSRKVF